MLQCNSGGLCTFSPSKKSVVGGGQSPGDVVVCGRERGERRVAGSGGEGGETRRAERGEREVWEEVWKT